MNTQVFEEVAITHASLSPEVIREVNLFFFLLTCVNLCEILSGLCSHFHTTLNANKSVSSFPVVSCVLSVFYIDTEETFVGSDWQETVIYAPKRQKRQRDEAEHLDGW